MSRIYYATLVIPIREDNEDQAFGYAHALVSAAKKRCIYGVEEEFPITLNGFVDDITEDEDQSKIIQEWES